MVLATAVVSAMSSRSASTGSAGTVTLAGAKNGLVSVNATLDRAAVLLNGDGIARMELVIAADNVDGEQRVQPTDLVIVLDRSGSMMGEKIAHAVASVRELAEQLRGEDRLALVSYASGARVDVPLTGLDGRGRGLLEMALAGATPSGGTNMSSGLDLGLRLLESGRSSGRIRHLILISDGLANEGDSSFGGLTARASLAVRAEFMLSTVGVGTDFNEQLMTAIADAGTGNYYYVRHAEDLGSVFAREFDAARSTVATGLAVRIEPAQGVRVTEVSGYPLENVDGAFVVRPGSLFSGQERRLWVSLAVPVHEVGDHQLGRVSVKYTDERGSHVLPLEDVPSVACVEGEKEYYAGFDIEAWGRSVAVEELNAVQEKVAERVKSGDRDEAIGQMRLFRRRIESDNQALDSPKARRAMRELDRMEQEVKNAFAGPLEHQKARQNELSKEMSAAAVDDRRVGAKKEVQP
jgi:Ca-activated chloride channel family protein